MSQPIDPLIKALMHEGRTREEAEALINSWVIIRKDDDVHRELQFRLAEPGEQDGKAEVVQPLLDRIAAYEAALLALGYRLEFPEREADCDVFHLVTGGKLGGADKTDPDSAGNAARVLGGQLNFDTAKEPMP